MRLHSLALFVLAVTDIAKVSQLPSTHRHGIEAVCGKAAAQTSESYLEYLCFTRNPLLGGVYLVMVAAIYYLYNLRVFGMLPTSVTPSWHMCDPFGLCLEEIVPC